jgi:hypothetical protein
MKEPRTINLTAPRNLRSVTEITSHISITPIGDWWSLSKASGLHVTGWSWWKDRAWPWIREGTHFVCRYS